MSRLKRKYKFLCLLLAFLMLAGTLAGCGVIKGDAVMSYGDYEITEAMYSYWLSRYKTLFLYSWGKDTDSFWSTEAGDGQTYESFIMDYINGYAKKVLIAMKLFDDFSLSFADGLKSDIESHIASLSETYGGKAQLEAVLGEYGLNIKTLKTIYYAENKLTAVNEYLFGDNGTNAVSDRDREKYYLENYYCAEWIYIYTEYEPEKGEDGGYLTDTSGNYIMEELSDERKAEQQAKLSEALAALEAGEKSFDSLKTQYSEDDLANYTKLPDGVNISPNDLDYGTGFIKALQGLEIGGHCLYEDGYATYILCRRELKDFDKLTDTELSIMADFETYVFDDKVERYYEEFEIILHENVISRYDIKTIKGLSNTNI